MAIRTPTKDIVKKISKILRDERPDYVYLRDLFRKIREEFSVTVSTKAKRLPYVPTEEELKRYYKLVWQTRNMKHLMLIKVMLYTGVRVQELVHMRIDEIDFDRSQIRISHGKGNKNRIVPFPQDFKETLMLFVNAEQSKGATYLFESSRKKPFTTRGIRKILAIYSSEAGMPQSISPHKLRHFLFTWLKKQGIDDALIQPYSGHETRQSLEIYSKLSLSDAQEAYDKAIDRFPF
jgi:integrase/recombinase XerD